jgi:Fe-S cluster assembly protein SufD
MKNLSKSMMQKKLVEYISQLPHTDRSLSQIREQSIVHAKTFDKYKWRVSKYLDYDTVIPEFEMDQVFTSRSGIHLQQKSQKRNLYITYNGAKAVCESVTEGVEIMDISEGLTRYSFLIKSYLEKRHVDRNESKLDILASSLVTNGMFIYVHDNACIEDTTIYVYESIGDEQVVDNRYNLVIIGKNNKVDIIHERLPIEFTGESLCNVSEDVFVNESSVCNYVNISTFAQNIFQTDSRNVYIAAHATANYFDFLLGGKAINQKIFSYLEGVDALFNLRGGSFATDEQVFETYALINNRAKSTSGKILYKNLVDNKAKLLFDGLIRVEKGADFTDSYLEDHTIMLSPYALSDSIPGLEIEANEVKASHGATIGSIDQDQLYYANSRGLDDSQAKKLLIEGFIHPIIDGLGDEKLKDRLMIYFSQKLHI